MVDRKKADPRGVRCGSASLLPEASEFLGTFALVFFGAGAGAILGAADQPTNPMLLLVIQGGVLAVCVQLLGPLSGSHFNPAVTVAFVLAGEFPVRRALPYIGMQIAGALAAVELLALGTGAHANAVVMQTGPNVGPLAALLAEAAGTSVLMLSIMAAATDRRFSPRLAGPIIGIGLIAGLVIAGPYSGGALNPARGLAPMAVILAGPDLWIHAVGPGLGAACGALLYRQSRPAGAHRNGARGRVSSDGR